MAVIEAIATTYLEADATSVEFSVIPSTYEHLQLRISSKSDRSSQWDPIDIVFNSDTTTVYAYHDIKGNAAAPTAGGWALGGPNAILTIFGTVGSTTSSSSYGTTIVDILNYADDGNRNTTVLCYNGSHGFSSDGVVNYGVCLNSALWDNTDDVTSIKMSVRNGTKFIRGSEITLYGLLGDT